MVSEILYNGACDRWHRIDCYFLRIINSNTVAICLNFILRDYKSIIFKPFISISLTRLLIYDDIIDSEFERNGTYYLRNVRQHIQQ